MTRTSQKDILLKLLREDTTKWFYSYELIKANTKYGWLGTSIDRQARKLVETGVIEKRGKGQYVQWKAKSPATIEVYTVGGREIEEK